LTASGSKCRFPRNKMTAAWHTPAIRKKNEGFIR
jgi:hypothetical protein